MTSSTTAGPRPGASAAVPVASARPQAVPDRARQLERLRRRANDAEREARAQRNLYRVGGVLAAMGVALLAFKITHPAQAYEAGVGAGSPAAAGAAVEQPVVARDPLSRQPVSISAVNPGEVLRAYCSSILGVSPSTAVGLTRTRPYFADQWLGVCQAGDGAGAFLAVAIHEDRKRHRWVAGNGKDPIDSIPMTRPAPGSYEPLP